MDGCRLCLRAGYEIFPRAIYSGGVKAEVMIIGHAPGSQHLWLSTGHGMMGVGMSAGSAQLLADLLTGRAPAIDPTPYRMERFT